MGIPRTIWMTTALLAPLVYTVARKRSNLWNPLRVAGSLIVGGLLTPFAVAVHTRIYEARFVESNRLINKLVSIRLALVSQVQVRSVRLLGGQEISSYPEPAVHDGCPLRGAALMIDYDPLNIE